MKRVLFAAAILIAAACASPRISSDFQSGDAEAAIRAANVRFITNAKNGDVDKLVDEFYAVDANVMAPGAPAFKGRDSIKKVMSALVGTGLQVTLTTDDVMQSGDLAVERGRYDMAKREQGKYIVVWRKIEGQWQDVDDIFNADAPTR